MQKYSLLLLFLTVTVFLSNAQQKLVFTHAQEKNVTVEQRDIVKFIYIGYLGQLQEVYGEVELVNDSFIRFENNWNVRVNDIIGFRKFSRYRNILQPTTQIITFIGVIVAVPTVLNNNPQFNDWERLGVTFGIGGIGSLINRLLFPTRIKNFLSDGWQVKVE